MVVNGRTQRSSRGQTPDNLENSENSAKDPISLGVRHQKEMRGLSLRQKKSLIENKSLNKAEQILQKCRKYNISVIRKNIGY